MPFPPGSILSMSDISAYCSSLAVIMRSTSYSMNSRITRTGMVKSVHTSERGGAAA